MIWVRHILSIANIFLNNFYLEKSNSINLSQTNKTNINHKLMRIKPTKIKIMESEKILQMKNVLADVLHLKITFKEFFCDHTVRNFPAKLRSVTGKKCSTDLKNKVMLEK